MTAPPDRSRLHWGISTLGCPELSYTEICELLREFGLQELELRLIDGRTDLPQWAAESGWSPERATALLAASGIHFRVAGSSFKLVGNDEKLRAELVKFCEWADSWNAPYVRAFGGGTWGKPLTETDYKEAAQTVAWWQAEREQRGWRVQLLLETHDAFSASGPCRELQARLDEPIGIIWDSHHTWRLGGESPQQSWEQLGRWIRHVHVKDSIAKPSARHPYTYVLPGDGEMPLADTIALLRNQHFSGTVSLEWERHWHPYLPSLKTALQHLQSQPWFTASGNEIATPVTTN